MIMGAEVIVGGNSHCVAKLQGEHTKAHESENMNIGCRTIKKIHKRLSRTKGTAAELPPSSTKHSTRNFHQEDNNYHRRLNI